ncbi:MAG: hypothetical protein V3S03_08395 [Vicinamibacteria bacterium]
MAAKRTERFSVVLAAVDKVSEPIRKINRRIDSMTAPLKRVGRAMRSLAREAGFGKLGTAIGGVGRQFARLGVLGAGAAAALLFAVKRAGQGADEYQKLSEQTGFAVEALQEFEFAAKQSGVSSSVFRQSVQALGKRVGELKAGTGALSTLLGKVDPAFKNQLARTTSTEEAMGLLLERINRLPNSLQKSALAAAAFSRSGLAMVNLAQQGATGIGELRQEARDLGGVLDSETTMAAAEMGDRLSEVLLLVKGLSTQILANLFPVVSEIATAFSTWAKDNRELIKTNLTEFLMQVVAGGRALVGVLREWIPKVAELVQRFGGMKLILGVLAATILLPLAAAIATVGAALASTAGLVIAGAAALGLIIGGIVSSWDSIEAAFLSVVASITSSIDELVAAIPQPLIDFLTAGGSALAAGFGFVTAGVPGLGPSLAAAGGAAQAPPGADSRIAVKIDVDQDGRVQGTTVDVAGAELDLEEGGTVGGGF